MNELPGWLVVAAVPVLALAIVRVDRRTGGQLCSIAVVVVALASHIARELDGPAWTIDESPADHG